MWPFKSGKDLAAPIDALGNAVDKVFTNDEERMQAQAVLDKLAMQPHVLQGELAKLEAQHRSPFVAGARPFILWVCGFALLQHFIVNPWLMFFMDGKKLDMDIGSLLELVLCLLGLGALRTAEKFGGVTK